MRINYLELSKIKKKLNFATHSEKIISFKSDNFRVRIAGGLVGISLIWLFFLKLGGDVIWRVFKAVVLC